MLKFCSLKITNLKKIEINLPTVCEFQEKQIQSFGFWGLLIWSNERDCLVDENLQFDE